MGREGIRKLASDAVEKGLEKDLELTDADKEVHQIRRNIATIKAFWSPKMPETKETREDRNDVLRSFLAVAIEANIDHQQIADWVYGAGKIDVESYLEELYVVEKCSLKVGEAEYAATYRPRLKVRLAPNLVASVVLAKSKRNGKYGVHIQIYDYKKSFFYVGWMRRGWRIVQSPLPRVFLHDSFEEAHRVVIEKIRWLREESGDVLVKGINGLRAAKTSDEVFDIVERLMQANALSRYAIETALNNQNFFWGETNLYVFFNLVFDYLDAYTGDLLILRNGLGGHQSLIKRIVWNLPSIMRKHPQRDLLFFRRRLGGKFPDFLKWFDEWFRHYKEKYPDRYKGVS